MHKGIAPNLERLGETIRAHRRDLGLTQDQLAQRLGWSQERVSVLENGKYGLPSLPLLAHLADSLDVPLVTLMEALGLSLDGTGRASGGEGGKRAALNYTLQRLLEIQALNLRDAMNQASDLLAQAMAADKVDLFLYEEETATLVTLGTSNTPVGRKQHRVGLDRLPIANGGRQVQVFLTGQEFYTGHAETDPEVHRGVVHSLGVRSLYVVPLRVDSTVRGILVAESVHPDRFSEAERDFFETAARWVGMITHRAELHEAVTRQTVEETRQMVAEHMLESVAHDLNNQITPIKGQIDLLRRHLHDEMSDQELSRISDSLSGLSRMVADLLDVSRLEGGIFSLNRRPTDLVALLCEVIDVSRVHRPEIQARLPEELIADIDPARITQAVQNLIGNAIQHTPAGTLIVVTLIHRPEHDAECALIRIQDEGAGIDPELRSTLFTRGAAGGDSPGTGLGLYLAHGIAVAHGGDLTVESQLGAGTTFTLTLPLGEA